MVSWQRSIGRRVRDGPTTHITAAHSRIGHVPTAAAAARHRGFVGITKPEGTGSVVNAEKSVLFCGCEKRSEGLRSLVVGSN